MKAQKFFSFLEHANTLILFILGIGGLFFFAFITKEVIGEFLHQSYQPEVVQVAGKKVDKADYFFRSFNRLPGTNIIMIDLQSSGTYDAGFSSGAPDIIRNYLFYDIPTRKARWLMQDHLSEIIWHEVISTKKLKDRPASTRAILYLIESISNSRHRNTRNLLISTPRGDQLTILLKDIQEVKETYEYTEGRILVFYISAHTLRTADVDIANRKILHDGEISPLPQK